MNIHNQYNLYLLLQLKFILITLISLNIYCDESEKLWDFKNAPTNTEFIEKQLSILKEDFESLFHFKTKWQKATEVIYVEDKRSYTSFENTPKGIKRQIFYNQKNDKTNRELYRELIRILFYDLIWLEAQTKNKTVTLPYIPLWIVEGILYNLKTDKLVSPHFYSTYRKMGRFFNFKELLSQKIFFTSVSDNTLFSFQSASLIEYIFSHPLGDQRLKNYIKQVQNVDSYSSFREIFTKGEKNTVKFEQKWLESCRLSSLY